MTVSSNRPDISPSVSVVIAVHNGLPYVEAALRSMMDQTLREIEIIVIDDASTDGTPQVLARLAAEDPRIRILTNETNLKLAASLNRGLGVARAPLIARMDADDLSMPHRLAVQKAYMDAHLEVVLLGASVRKIDGNGRVLHNDIRNHDDFMVRWNLHFGTPVVHPTFMFRRIGPDGRPMLYDTAFPVSQDYDFIARAADQGRIVSLPDILVDWRDHDSSTSMQSVARQIVHGGKVAQRIHERNLSPELQRDIASLINILRGDQALTVFDVFRYVRLMRKMIASYARSSPHRVHELRRSATFRLLYRRNKKGLGRRLTLLTLLFAGPELAVTMRSEIIDRIRRMVPVKLKRV